MKPNTKQPAKDKRPNKFRSDDEIAELQQRYASLAALEPGAVKRFSDFPLSRKTLSGLTDSKYFNPTSIQRDSIGPALQGKDVLGAAVTGSGKTLAFLIPILEHLYTAKWSRSDGIAAIIISPTRELAYQIFETLKKIGKHHDFSAGLIIGGKNLKFERTRMDQCNILICTPGRLLQHMDENPLFNATAMEMLVLDEADRCLDMGFEQALNAIIENFPPDRQTLLFSATQTNSVKDLARLNLRNPVYVGHTKEVSAAVLPDLLQQNYVVMPLEEKITMLWSFIKNHLKQKIIVFFSSCKQVKFTYEIFCKLRPGTSLLALYGSLHQDKRLAIYNDFVKKSNVVLFATDIASRGLDFPGVNWVIQLDCPEDVTQYIHRAGRSARNKARGESLLVLTPSEEQAMVDELAAQKISAKKIQIDAKKLFSPRVKIEAFLAQNPELKASAQRAFISYIKSIFLMKNKRIFNVHSVNFDAYAKSLGLVVTPRVRFLERQKNNSKGLKASDIDVDVKEKFVTSKRDDFNMNDSQSESDDEGFIKVKRVDHDLQNCGGEDDASEVLPIIPKREKLVTKAALAKKAIKKKIQINEKVNFDEDGQEIVDTRKQMQSSLARQIEGDSENHSGGINIDVAKKLLSEEDKYDKQRFRELVKQRHRKLKEKRKQADVALDDEHDESVGDDSGDESVDLSWLPDPSNIDEAEDSADQPHLESPTKKHSAQTASKRNSKRTADMAEPPAKKKVTSKLSLNDAEVIASQLLANFA